ncbi:cytochrome P450 [Lojkania enalia]|uniref:Cytochrome P450 n=1 Tax=Lojkania enalia TaxID=147567 RepID=A0A9P4KDU5_9PLEO|nr:cytochrome P450 [Didymosphaeria enalia]
MLSPTFLIALLLFSLLIIYVRRRRRRRRQNLSPSNFPPGPPPIPILGNLHQVPLKKAYLQFTKWSRQYGPILGLRFGPQKVIVLNNWRSVRDLFDQRGSIYSSRPDIAIAQHVVPGDRHLAFMKYDKRWRRGRKTINDFLKDEVVSKLLPIQDAESTQMVWEVMNEPAGYYGHVMRQFASVILASVYEQRGKVHRGERTEQFYAVQDEWAAVLDPGAMPPYDIFPVLRYVPDAWTPWRGWRKRADDLGNKQGGLYRELFQEAKVRVRNGQGSTTFAATLLANQEKEGYSDAELEYIAGFMLEAGADTTAMSFLTFIVALAAYPNVLKQAQKEVDEVFGDSKMPGSLEGIKLPYIQGCFWETLRWRPALPIAIPHAIDKDDMYQGYGISANSTVIMNIWAIHHNPEDYPNPDVFDPARFLTSKFGVANSTPEAEADLTRRESYAFGAGRRVCAGQKMAENSLVLAMAKFVWAFDVVWMGEEALDTNVETAWKDAILTAPKEVPIGFSVRGEKREEIIRKEWSKAEAYLKKFE